MNTVSNVRWTPIKTAKSQLVEITSCKFDLLCLLVPTCYFCQYYWLWRSRSPSKYPQLFAYLSQSPIKWAVASGNENKEFYMKSSNFKWTSIATLPDWRSISVFFPTPLISHYYLPLIPWTLLLKKILEITLAEMDEEFSDFFNIK